MTTANLSTQGRFVRPESDPLPHPKPLDEVNDCCPEVTMALDVWEALAELLTPNEDLARHRADPAAWARERLDSHLWSKQVGICQSVATNRRTAVKSGHGVGKSWTAGMLAAWWIDTHPPGEAIVVSTAPTYKQVHAVLWEEIRRHHRNAGLPGKILGTDEWKIDDVLVGMGRKPADHDEHGFQGIHRRYVLAILDEACGVPAPLWTAVEAITTNADARVLAIGNPDDPNTEFGKVCGPGSGWNVIRISTLDSPNFTGEQIPASLAPMLPSQEWVDDARKRWGVDSPLFRSKVEGEFPESSEDTLIPQRLIIAAQNRDLPPADPSSLGVDVARFGTDRSIVYQRRGPHVRLWRDWAHAPTTETTGLVIEALRATGAAAAHVDGVGVGGGVVDQLAEQGYPALDMQAGGAAQDRERFINARAEWYWGLRERFESGDIDLDPDDDEAASQLAALRYTYDSRGRIKIESKDDMRKRGMPSPDRADGLMLAFAKQATNHKISDHFIDLG